MFTEYKIFIQETSCSIDTTRVLNTRALKFSTWNKVTNHIQCNLGLISQYVYDMQLVYFKMNCDHRRHLSVYATCSFVEKNDKNLIRLQ